MNDLFKDKEHLVRMAALFVVGIALFALARAVLVPKGFGQLGHYRAGALEDNRRFPLSYAGRTACEPCHSDVVESRKGSRHAAIGCETCHGPLAAHAAADDPASRKPPRPDGRQLCLGCHAENLARPKAFPQIKPKDHGDAGACIACHKPHHPAVRS